MFTDITVYEITIVSQNSQRDIVNVDAKNYYLPRNIMYISRQVIFYHAELKLLSVSNVT